MRNTSWSLDQTRGLIDRVLASIQEAADEGADVEKVRSQAFYYLLHRAASVDPSAVELLVDDLRSMAVRLRVEKYDGLADTGSGPVRAVPIRSAEHDQRQPGAHTNP